MKVTILMNTDRSSLLMLEHGSTATAAACSPVLHCSCHVENLHTWKEMCFFFA